jgi:hypothetical protein
MTTLALSLWWQPEEPVTLPSSPFSEGDVLLFIALVLVVAGVFGFDMVRTWWETNEWKRDARRRKREMR